MATINRFVQICPHDGPPFLDLCNVYARAADVLGLAATTVFLGRPQMEPASTDHRYLNLSNLRATRRIGRQLRDLLPDLGNSLVLCHRYRAYWLFVRSGLAAGQVVALAHGHGSFNRPSRRLGRLLFGRGPILAGVSPTVTEELRKLSGTALHLPNALDLTAYECLDRAGARRQLGLPAEGVCIGVIGRLHYKKNPALALAAGRSFMERYGPAHLGFVGEGALRQDLQRAATGLPITFTGFVTEPRRLMRAFDAILLTPGTRAFPKWTANMVALEAMSAAVPVVAPNRRDAVSILGTLGFYFDAPNPEAISAALHEALASPKPSAGPQRVQEEFSVMAVARRLQRLLI